jgi:hypothetical protein
MAVAERCLRCQRRTRNGSRCERCSERCSTTAARGYGSAHPDEHGKRSQRNRRAPSAE